MKKNVEFKNGTNNLDIVVIYGITIIALNGIISVSIIFWRRKLMLILLEAINEFS